MVKTRAGHEERAHPIDRRRAYGDKESVEDGHGRCQPVGQTPGIDVVESADHEEACQTSDAERGPSPDPGSPVPGSIEGVWNDRCPEGGLPDGCPIIAFGSSHHDSAFDEGGDERREREAEQSSRVPARQGDDDDDNHQGDDQCCIR